MLVVWVHLMLQRTAGRPSKLQRLHMLKSYWLGLLTVTLHEGRGYQHENHWNLCPSML